MEIRIRRESISPDLSRGIDYCTSSIVTTGFNSQNEERRGIEGYFERKLKKMESRRHKVLHLPTHLLSLENFSSAGTFYLPGITGICLILEEEEAFLLSTEKGEVEVLSRFFSFP